MKIDLFIKDRGFIEMDLKIVVDQI